MRTLQTITIQVLMLLILFTGVKVSKAQSEREEYKDFLYEEFKSSDGEKLKYRVIRPNDYDKSKDYPLIVFLHGSGERGDDNKKQLTHGAKVFDSLKKAGVLKSVVIFPQCPQDEFWPFNEMPSPNGQWDRITYPVDAESSPSLRMVSELVDFMKDKKRVEDVTIIGLSMGGMGVLDFFVRNPTKFENVISICGGVNMERFNNIESNTNVLLFHGEADDIVPVENSIKLDAKLKEKGIKSTLVIYPGVKHNSWDNAFKDTTLLKILSEE